MPDRSAGPHGGLGDLRVQPVGDVLDGAAGVQVRRPPHPDPLARRQDVVHRVARLGRRPPRWCRRPGSATRRRWPAPGAGWSARISSRTGCRPSPTTSAGRRTAAATTWWSMTTTRRSSPCTSSSTSTSGQNCSARSTARSSPSSSVTPTVMPLPCSPRAGLTTTSPTSRSRRGRLLELALAGQRAAGHPHAGALHDPAGHPLVVAAAHRDRAGELRQRLAGQHRAAAHRQPHLAPLGVGDLDADAAAQRLLGDDPGVGVEVLQPRRPRGEQRGVDRVLALDAHGGDPGEPELAVQRDRRARCRACTERSR